YMYEKLLQQEDQAHTNIQFVMSSSSIKAKINFSDLSTLLKVVENLVQLWESGHIWKWVWVIGESCKKLCKFKTDDRVTEMELITMVKGCLELECLHIHLKGISNVTLECIDNGIRAMLIGCSKLKRLRIHLRPQHGGLTDVGLGYIGKYGHNLRYLSLGYAGESDAGLVELSKGCLKLRKLEMVVCPFSEQAIATFVFNIHSLRYWWLRLGSDATPTSQVIAHLPFSISPLLFFSFSGGFAFIL
nr:hypothetical protein [Tanacetum cinerariifolium]